VVLLAFGIGACSRDRAPEPGEITSADSAAFTAPADSSLTVAQVDHYLRTTLAQFNILRAEAPAMRERLAAAQRAREQAAPTTPRSARPRSRQALWSDYVDAAFVRAARRLRYNPAELWYVRERMAAVSGHLLAGEMYASSDEGAALLRQQAGSMRGTPGVAEVQIEAMLRAADQAEQQTARPPAPRLVQNLAVLRQARGSVSDSTWRRVAGIAAGIGLSDLTEIPEEEAVRRLGEFRRLYVEVLENREPSG
jgi:hypothetical protein